MEMNWKQKPKSECGFLDFVSDFESFPEFRFRVYESSFWCIQILEFCFVAESIRILVSTESVLRSCICIWILNLHPDSKI